MAESLNKTELLVALCGTAMMAAADAEKRGIDPSLRTRILACIAKAEVHLEKVQDARPAGEGLTEIIEKLGRMAEALDV